LSLQVSYFLKTDEGEIALAGCMGEQRARRATSRWALEGQLLGVEGQYLLLGDGARQPGTTFRCEVTLQVH